MVKNSIKMLLCTIIFITTGILAASFNRCNHLNIKNTDYNNNQILIESFDSISYKKDSLRNLLIIEAQSFINSKAPNAHKDIAILLVDNGLQHKVDIVFIMAQAHYETKFGTTGAGKPTSRYSLFGVNGKYNNYEDAVNKYIILLKGKYLTKGKTEQHLMRNFTNVNGHRYATNIKYESILKEYYKELLKVSNIKNIQNEYNELL